MKFAVSSLFLSFTLAAADRPELLARDVVRAADRSSGAVAPGEIVVLLQSNAGPEGLAEYQRDGDGKLARLLGDTRVWFDGIAAPVVYSMRGQVGAVVPYEISGRKATAVEVEYRGVRSLPVTLPVVGSAPALFTLDSSGRGQAAMLNETGCCNSARNPAARGSVAALYATGEGQTNPPGITGNISAYLRTDDYPAPQQKVSVTVGGVPEEILFVGEAPHMVSGLLQVNFRIPAKAPLGDAVPLVLTVGDSRSPDGVTMAVRSAVQRIVIADNDAANRNSLRTMLTRAGYEVIVARNGEEAQAHANERPIDMLICNLALPEQERMETVAAMLAGRPKLKIVATAAALDPDTLRSADLLGAQAVLTKSMASKLVLARIRDLLRSRPVPYVAADAVKPFPIAR
jgi:uncharacterized protein (TIGR03437 family)